MPNEENVTGGEEPAEDPGHYLPQDAWDRVTAEVEHLHATDPAYHPDPERRVARG